MSEISTADLEKLCALLNSKPLPVPAEALALLHRTARGDTGGSVGTRGFLFWLVGESEPTGCASDGAMELRRFDSDHREAALEVLNWWISGTSDDQPIHDILEDLTRRFAVNHHTGTGT